MVEEHSPEFVDAGEKQKIDFFDGDVHLGHYDFRFDFILICIFLDGKCFVVA